MAFSDCYIIRYIIVIIICERFIPCLFIPFVEAVDARHAFSGSLCGPVDDTYTL